jgi:predicted RNase H-like HicB family nuclease
MTKRYAILISKVPNSNYSAHAPDVDGCIATGATPQEVIQLMKEGLEFHFQGMREDGDPIPDPITEVAYVDVEIPAPVPDAVRVR